MFESIKNVWSRIWTKPEPAAEQPKPSTPRPIVLVKWPLGAMMHPHSSGTYSYRRAKPDKDTRKYIRVDASDQVRRTCPLILENIGYTPAINIAIQPVNADFGRLEFPEQPAALAPGAEVAIEGAYRRNDNFPNFRGSTVSAEGVENYFLHRSFLMEDADWAKTDFLEQEVIVTYSDIQGYNYWTKAVLRYQSTARFGYVKSLQFQDMPLLPADPPVEQVEPMRYTDPRVQAFGEATTKDEELP